MIEKPFIEGCSADNNEFYLHEFHQVQVIDENNFVLIHRSNTTKNRRIGFQRQEDGSVTWHGLPIAMLNVMKVRYKNGTFMKENPKLALQAILLESK